MIKKELDIPFSFCMGGYYIDPKICDNLVDFYDEHKSKAQPGIVNKRDVNDKPDIVVDKKIKDSNDLQFPGDFHEGPVADYKDSLGACLKSYENKNEYPFIWFRLFKDSYFNLSNPWAYVNTKEENGNVDSLTKKVITPIKKGEELFGTYNLENTILK